jgi:Adenylate and Guanylate cyclase catalytic domain
MESNGIRGKIQVSQETANLLVEADKEYWLIPREDKIMAKGKGTLQTFFVDPTKKRASSCDSEEASSKTDKVMKEESFPESSNAPTSVNDRLINWMVDLFLEDIKKLVSSVYVY